MNKEYSKFMREKIGKEYNDFIIPDHTESHDHGSDKESFKYSYEGVYKIKGVKIYHLDKPRILRVGYVIDYGDCKIWHTVRLAAWTGKINGIVCNNYLESFPEEIKYTKYNRFEIMDI